MSETLLQRVKKVRISDTVVDQIIALIENGRLRVGDQLPGERELVNQLQVGRASVREALRILEAQGVIEVSPGKGTFITSEVSRLADQEGVRLWFQQHAGEVLEMLEIRTLLERYSARLAATRATRQQIDQARRVLDDVEEALGQGDLDILGYGDQSFHRLLAEASGNNLLLELIDAIIEAMVSPRRTIQRLPGRAQVSLDEHRAILQAITDRDPEAAEQAVIQHMASVRDALEGLKQTPQT
jgi:GntR family transcriptional repressor for pyruvate dehydrogenase complex